MSEFDQPNPPEPPEVEPSPAEATPDPPAADAAPAWTPPSLHPVQLLVTDDLRRSRVTVLLRLFLTIPHFVVLVLWGIVVFFAVIGAWFAALILGRVPDDLHAFVARYLRYSTQVSAYLMIAANPFPGFGGNTPYPVDLEIAPPTTQNRLTVFFRVILVIPIWIVLSILQYLIPVAAVLAWLLGLVMGRIPQGVENILTFYIRLNARYYAYVCLLTPKYPSFD